MPFINKIFWFCNIESNYPAVVGFKKVESKTIVGNTKIGDV